MARHGKIVEFDQSKESWDAYIKRLELYFVVNDIDDAAKKRAVLLTVCGANTHAGTWQPPQSQLM